MNSLNVVWEQANNRVLEKYLFEQALETELSTKKRIFGSLKPFFAFYKQEINPAFILPDFAVKLNRTKGLYSELSREDIQKLH